MRDINIVVLVGRLTRDAELKYTNSGQPICRFSIATNRSKKQGDQWVDEASFIDVDLWGKQGEAVNQYLVKGKQVAIEGELKQDRWEQDGQSRSKVLVNASNVQLLGSKDDGHGAAKPATQANAAPTQAQLDASNPRRDDFTDDIPF